MVRRCRPGCTIRNDSISTVAVLLTFLVVCSVSKTVCASQNLTRCEKRTTSERCHSSQYCGQITTKVGEGGWTQNFCLCCCRLAADAPESGNATDCNWNFTLNSARNQCYNTSGCPVHSTTTTTNIMSSSTSTSSDDTDDGESAVSLAVPVSVASLLLLGLISLPILYCCKSNRVQCKLCHLQRYRSRCTVGLKKVRCSSSSRETCVLPSPTDEIVLQETFRILCPSPLPPIDGESHVAGSGQNRLHRTSRTSLPNSSLSALSAVHNLDGSWQMFCKFCGSLDIGKLPDMDWRNVAQDLGYQVRDIEWITASLSGRSKSLVCIQDFLGRTPLSKSDEAFQFLHKSVSRTENRTALEELESVQVQCRDGIVTVRQLALRRHKCSLDLGDPVFCPTDDGTTV